MKKMRLGIFLGALVALCGLAWAGTLVRYTSGGNQVYLLQDDGTQTQKGALKFGNDSASPTLPTTSTGGSFGVKIPVYNVGSAVTQGAVLCSSNTGTGYVSACGTTATSYVGIADAAIASGAKGWATVSGYALALTTGTVNIGDVVISTSVTSGYGQANNTPVSGTNIGVSMSAGTAAGGLTLIRVK